MLSFSKILITIATTGAIFTASFLVTNLDNEKPPTTLFTMGDIMLGRYVETLSNKNGITYPFENIKTEFTNYDLVFGNLEGPIQTDHRQTPDFTTVFSFHPKVANLLKDVGIDLVSLANNHTFDYEQPGYQESWDYLIQAGIKPFGHPNQYSQQYVQKVEVNDLQVAFVGLHKTINNFDEQAALATISLAKADADLVLVSIHWGIEYERVNSESQKVLAHKLIDAGADAIIGHHPHVVQNVEIYNNKPIFYSLGNFIFDQYFSPYTQEGLTVAITIADNQTSYKLLPVSIIKSQPQLMTELEREDWLQDLAARSDSSLAEQITNGILTVNR